MATHLAFADVTVDQWREVIPSTRDEYLALIGTYSGPLTLAEEPRNGLLDCLGDLMDRDFGGRVDKMYRFELILATRR